MSFPHEVIAAFPTGGRPNPGLIRAMCTRRFAYSLAADEIASDFVAKDPVSGVPPLNLIQFGTLYAYDETDSTTAPSDVCLVTSDACRYKSGSVGLPESVLTYSTTAQPADVDVSDGDTFLLPIGATGADWAGKAGQIAIRKGARWYFAISPIGRGLYVEDEDARYYRNASGVWTAGSGSVTLAANSVKITNVLGAKASFVVKVENQTTRAPPGSRVTSATPTAPLGGTAANLNDNNDATVTTTSAIGDLSAAALSSRFFAQLDLGASKNIVAIDVRGLLLSTAGPADNLRLYTSPDGTTWTAYGAVFSATNVTANVLRSGAVSARYVAVAAIAANYGSITLQLSGLNVYDTTVVSSPGEAYIVDASPIGPWASDAGKLAICLATNTFTIIAPDEGDEVYDKTNGNSYRFNGTAWISTSGAIIKRTPYRYATDVFTSSAIIPFDNTIPQISEGSELFSVSYTMRSSANRINVRLSGFGCVAGVNQSLTAALFFNSNSNAIATSTTLCAAINNPYPIYLENEFSPSTASDFTISIRVGTTSGAVYIGGNSSGRFFGGAGSTVLVIEEIEP